MSLRLGLNLLWEIRWMSPFRIGWVSPWSLGSKSILQDGMNMSSETWFGLFFWRSYTCPSLWFGWEYNIPGIGWMSLSRHNSKSAFADWVKVSSILGPNYHSEDAVKVPLATWLNISFRRWHECWLIWRLCSKSPVEDEMTVPGKTWLVAAPPPFGNGIKLLCGTWRRSHFARWNMLFSRLASKSHFWDEITVPLRTWFEMSAKRRN